MFGHHHHHQAGAPMGMGMGMGSPAGPGGRWAFDDWPRTPYGFRHRAAQQALFVAAMMGGGQVSPRMVAQMRAASVVSSAVGVSVSLGGGVLFWALSGVMFARLPADAPPAFFVVPLVPGAILGNVAALTDFRLLQQTPPGERGPAVAALVLDVSLLCCMIAALATWARGSPLHALMGVGFALAVSSGFVRVTAARRVARIVEQEGMDEGSDGGGAGAGGVGIGAGAGAGGGATPGVSVVAADADAEGEGVGMMRPDGYVRASAVPVAEPVTMGELYATAAAAAPAAGAPAAPARARMSSGELAAALVRDGVLSSDESELLIKNGVDASTARYLDQGALAEMGITKAVTRAKVLGWVEDHLKS